MGKLLLKVSALFALVFLVATFFPNPSIAVKAPTNNLLAQTRQAYPVLSANSTSQLPASGSNVFLSEASIDARFAGLLSHVHWLIDQQTKSKYSVRSTSSGSSGGGVDVTLFNKQMESLSDDISDSAADLRKEIAASAILSTDSVTPDDVSSVGQIDESCLTYEATGDTWEWQTCGTGGVSGFATTSINTSAKIANIVTDETGSGALVFANSPAFIGILTAANANFSGNVGIGTTTPDSKLTVQGGVNATGHAHFGNYGSVDNEPYDWGPINAVLTLDEHYTGAPSPFGGNFGLMNNYMFEPSADGTGATGSHNVLMVNGTHDFNTAIGVGAYAYNSTSGTVTNVIGLDSYIDAGNATNAYGISVGVETGGTLTNGYGVYINSAVNGGTFTNNYGLYIDDQSGVGSSNSFNIYSAGATAKNYFAGKVGIGTSSPLTKLHIVDSIDGGTYGEEGLIIQNTNPGTSAYASLAFRNDAGSDATIWFGSSNNSDWEPNILSINNSVGAIELDTAGGGLRLSADGNVGIGSTSPSAKLTVQNTGSGNSFIVEDQAGDTTPFVIDASGNVRIGTGQGGRPFSFGANSTATSGFNNYLADFYFEAQPASNSTALITGLTSGLVTQYGTSVNHGTLRSLYGSAFHQGTGTLGAAYGVSGYVGNDDVGTISEAIPGRFGAYNFGGGTITNLKYIEVESLANSGSIITNTYGLYLGDLTDGTQTNAPFAIYSSDSGAKSYFAGRVGIGTTTPAQKLQVFGDVRVGTTGSNGCLENFGGGVIGGTCSSDEQLKTNIVPIASSTGRSFLAGVAALTPVTYNWNEEAAKLYSKDKKIENIGLIAQNVEGQFPELVSRNKEGYRQVDFTALQFYVIGAIKELWAIVQGHDERLANLEQENQALKDRLSNIESKLDMQVPAQSAAVAESTIATSTPPQTDASTPPEIIPTPPTEASTTFSLVPGPSQ